MQFEIKNRIIKSKTQKLIVGDNADYVAHFSFDEEWEGVTKTARFVSCKGSYKDVLIENDECKIPCEVLKCGYTKVGVYSAEMTTTEYEFLVIASIKDEIGCECEPTPNVYEQLTGKLDDIQASMGNEVAEYFTEHKEEFKGDKGEKGDAGAIRFVVVTELPTENIDESAIHLKPSSDPQSQNAYDEYIYTNGNWECIGTANVKVDLTDYVKNTDYATASKGGVIKAQNVNQVNRGVYISSEGFLSLKIATEAEIKAKSANTYNVISPANLDKAVKEGLTTNTIELTEEEKAAAQNWLGVGFKATQLEDGTYSLTIIGA